MQVKKYLPDKKLRRDTLWLLVGDFESLQISFKAPIQIPMASGFNKRPHGLRITAEYLGVASP